MTKKSRSFFAFRQLAGLMSLLAATALLAACDDGQEPMDEVNCALEDRAQSYVAGLIGEGATEIEITLLESVPGPPAKGDSTWRIQVMDGAGTPLSGLTVTVTPYMPDHGHGTPIPAEVTELADPGQYEVAPVNLWMPGLWEVNIEVTDGAALTDAATFSFCIEG